MLAFSHALSWQSTTFQSPIAIMKSLLYAFFWPIQISVIRFRACPLSIFLSLSAVMPNQTPGYFFRLLLLRAKLEVLCHWISS